MTRTLTCEEVVSRLWLFLDGALPERERASIVAHLEGCADCLSHHDFARAFLDAVRHAHGATDEFAGLRTRVEKAIAEMGPGREARGGT